MRFGLPFSTPRIPVNGNGVEFAKFNDQVLLSGSDPEFVNSDMIFFLEYLYGTGSVQMKDRAGNNVGAAITAPALDFSHAPIRFDGGIKLTGTILIAKGFFIPAGQELTLI